MLRDARVSNSPQFPSLHFELHGVEGRLQQMDVAVVGVDHQFPIGPLRIFMSADEEFEGELFENKIVSGLEFAIVQTAKNGAGFGDVLDGDGIRLCGQL
jgi:hypothetical protein